MSFDTNFCHTFVFKPTPSEQNLCALKFQQLLLQETTPVFPNKTC